MIDDAMSAFTPDSGPLARGARHSPFTFSPRSLR